MKTQTPQPQVIQYLSNLEKHLKHLPQQEREEIKREIQSRIADEIDMANLNTETEIKDMLTRMGSARKLATELGKEHLEDSMKNVQIATHHKVFWQRALKPMIWVMATFTVLAVIRDIVLFAPLVEPSLSTYLTLILRFLPASLMEILVLGLPIAISLGCALYAHHVLSTTQRIQFSDKAKLWGIIIAVGLVSSTSSFYLFKATSSSAYAPTPKTETLAVTPEQHQQPDFMIMPTQEAKLWFKNNQNTLRAEQVFAYKTRYAFPTACLAFALWGGLTGLLMASAMVPLTYTLIALGAVVPGLFWFIAFFSLKGIIQHLPAGSRLPDVAYTAAYLPTFAMLLICMPIILGTLLYKQREEE